MGDPNMETPTKEEIQAFVDQLVGELMPVVDKNGDGEISKEEFKTFGTYLEIEYKKLQKELQSRRRLADGIEVELPSLAQMSMAAHRRMPAIGAQPSSGSDLSLIAGVFAFFVLLFWIVIRRFRGASSKERRSADLE